MANTRSNHDLEKNKCEREYVEKKDWANLLPELLILVMSRLIVKDNIRASSVCKAWYKSSVSVRMKDQHLWFMKYPMNDQLLSFKKYPKSSTSKGPCEFYDPLQEMTYTIEFPEIAGMSVYHAKDGWLLMHKGHPSELCFFNPFTRSLISLPKCENYNKRAVFTCAPTCDRCLVLGLANIDKNNNLVGFNTLKLGETKWETTRFMSIDLFFAFFTKIIFLGGLFYFLGGSGSLMVFDPSKRTLCTHQPTYDGGFPPSTIWIGTYFIEIKGDIFLLRTMGENLRLFRLNHDKAWFWEEKDKFDEGLTIFGASRTSECRSYLSKSMRNKLLLSDTHHPTFTTYVFDEGKYIIGDSCIPIWDAKTSFQSMWIEPPKQALEFV